MEKELTYKEIRKNKEINTLLERGNEVLFSYKSQRPDGYRKLKDRIICVDICAMQEWN